MYVNASSAPVYPETMEAGHMRYAAALQDVADRHSSCNILVVTHGEAVRQSVARMVCDACCLWLHSLAFCHEAEMQSSAVTNAMSANAADWLAQGSVHDIGPPMLIMDALRRVTAMLCTPLWEMLRE